MLTEYLAHALLAERLAEVRRFRLAEEAAYLNDQRSWLARLSRRRAQPAASRARSARSTSGHSLSTME
jgi:hypothetical protein